MSWKFFVGASILTTGLLLKAGAPLAAVLAGLALAAAANGMRLRAAADRAARKPPPVD